MAEHGCFCCSAAPCRQSSAAWRWEICPHAADRLQQTPLTSAWVPQAYLRKMMSACGRHACTYRCRVGGC